jgi:hypothetical protein
VSWVHLALPHDESGTAVGGLGCLVTATYVTL